MLFVIKKELTFAIPQALAWMEERVSMHWTPLFAIVRCDTQENIVEVRECFFVLFLTVRCICSICSIIDSVSFEALKLSK